MTDQPNAVAEPLAQREEISIGAGAVRFVLWLNLILGILNSLFGVIGAPVFAYISKTSARSQFWLQPWVLVTLLVQFGLPMLLIYGTIHGLKLNPRGRTVLIVWCWCAMAFAMMRPASLLWQVTAGMGDGLYAAVLITSSLRESACASAIPLVTLMLLTRSYIKPLFVPFAKGFEIVDPTRDA